MAAIVTLLSKTGKSIEAFTMSSVAYDSEPWRLVISALPHGDAMHLAFNLLWFWILGTQIEEALGHVKAFALIVVLAVGSASAQFALSDGGIGLSGVGYGQVGFLFVMARFDPRLRGAIDRRTLILFGGWFVFCIVTTQLGLWRIANVAHGSGFVLGMLLGAAVAPLRPVVRGIAAFGFAVTFAASLAGAAWWRPYVNLSPTAGHDDAYRGWRALDEDHYELAAKHLERALAVSPDDAGSWVNYGIVLEHLPDHPALDGVTPFECYRRATAADPDDATAYWNLGRMHAARGDADHARQAFARAAALDPAKYAKRQAEWLQDLEGR